MPTYPGTVASVEPEELAAQIDRSLDDLHARLGPGDELRGIRADLAEEEYERLRHGMKLAFDAAKLLAPRRGLPNVEGATSWARDASSELAMVLPTLPDDLNSSGHDLKRLLDTL
jgi:hypothetical protein